MMETPIETAIMLPFDVDPHYGTINMTTSQSKIWEDRVVSVLGTMKTERVMNMSFGTTVPTAVFQNMDIVTDLITKEVNYAFIGYLPLLTLDKVTVTIDEQSGVISADVLYSLPNKEQSLVTIGVATLSGSGLISEERK